MNEEDQKRTKKELLEKARKDYDAAKREQRLAALAAEEAWHRVMVLMDDEVPEGK